MRNDLDESCRENQNPHFVFGKDFFSFFENRTVYEIMLEGVGGILKRRAGHR